MLHSALCISENASRICLPNGTWYVRSSVNGSSSGWTNFTSCVANVTEEPSHDFNLGVADIVLVSLIWETYTTLVFIYTLQRKLEYPNLYQCV